MSALRWWVIACALAAAPVGAQPPDQRVAGEITGSDHQSYRAVPFDVPPGVERITVRLHYDKSNKTVLDLGLWDPQGFRGWSGGTRDRVTIGTADASPGYLPGSIPSGKWYVELGVPNARPDSRSAYAVEIFFDRGDMRSASLAIGDPPLRTGPGWYRGDLHMHDAHSDGSCADQSGKRVPCPLFRTVEAAAKAGLDFVAVTDHNTVSHFDGLRELQPFFDRLLLIPGTEITTFHGHANAIGLSRWIDFRVGTAAVPDIKAVEHAVAQAGGIVSINHPGLPSGELCMGCGWTWPGTDYAGITAIEAVNAVMSEGPYAGIEFWYARLNEGHHLTGIAGSDNHDPDPIEGKAPIGRPTTVVHAANLSQPAILDGIRAGNVFIDVEGTRDRLLEVEARSGASMATMGATLHPTGTIQVQAHVVGAAGAELQLIANGKQAGRMALTGADERLSLPIARRRACGWISVNVLNPAGRRLLIGNPIYVDCMRRH